LPVIPSALHPATLLYISLLVFCYEIIYYVEIISQNWSTFLPPLSSFIPFTSLYLVISSSVALLSPLVLKYQIDLIIILLLFYGTISHLICVITLLITSSGGEREAGGICLRSPAIGGGVREEICERLLQKGLGIAQQWDIATERRVRRRRRMPGEDARDAGLTRRRN